jgi:hypothetical protein
MAKAGHGLLKVSLGSTMPYPSTPCGRPPLKRPYGRVRGGRPQGRRIAAIFYPLGHPTPYASAASGDDGTANYGVCSNWIASHYPGCLVFGFVQPHEEFHMPRDASVPIVMVGAGVSIAPFR